MLQFLTSIFDSRPDPDAILRDDVVKAAIERAIDKTDRRLRALGNYRKRLHDPVATALHHVMGLVEGLPEPVEIGPGRYGQDSRLRALFASAEHLSEVLGRFQTVREYLERHSGLPPDAVFGLLTVTARERRMLGMELEGEQVKRDVLQTAVTFEDHQFFAPSDSEEDARTELTTLGFDFLLKMAMDTLAAHKLRRGELARKRQLLRRKLLASTSVPSEPVDYAALEADIAMIEEELGCFSGIELSLDESLQRIAAILSEADKWLTAAPFRVGLDYRNMKTKASATLEMSELATLNGTRRVVLFGRIPRLDLPEPRNALKLGQAYLG